MIGAEGIAIAALMLALVSTARCLWLWSRVSFLMDKVYFLGQANRQVRQDLLAHREVLRAAAALVNKDLISEAEFRRRWDLSQ